MLKCKMYQGLPSRIKEALQKFLKESNLSIDDIKISQSQFRNDIVLTLIYQTSE